MNARLVTLASPWLEIGYPGFVSGLGVYAAAQLLGERLLGGALVPVALLVPLGAWAFGARREPGQAPLLRPLLLAAAVAIGCASVADMAREFHLSVDPTRIGVASLSDLLGGIELLGFLLLSPVPLARVGKALGDAVLRSPRLALAWALGSFAVGLGFLAGLGIVIELGHDEAWLVFAAALTPLLGSRRLSIAVLLACAVTGIWVRSKASDFRQAAATDAWLSPGRAVDRKPELARERRCEPEALGGAALRPDCGPSPLDDPQVHPVVAELGERLDVRNVVYLGFAVPRAPVELLAAAPRVDRLKLASPQAWPGHHERMTPDRAKRLGWTDPRVNTTVADPRSFLQRSQAPADLVFVDGVDAPSGLRSLLMIPWPAWLFTTDGYRALFRVLGEDGVLVVERTVATPDDLSRMLGGAPAGVRTAWVPCPTSGTACVWVGATRSEQSWNVLRESLGAASGHVPRDLPSGEAGRVADDGRPIVIFPDEIYAIAAALALLALAGLIAARRWWWPVAVTDLGWTGVLAGMSFSLAQLATSGSLGRPASAPGSFEALLFALGWIAASVAGLAVDRWRASFEALARSPVALASSMIGAALLVSVVMLAVVSPFANRDLASIATVLACGASALGWMLALEEAGLPLRRAIFVEALLGYAFGLVLAPVLIAAHGFDLVALASGGCAVLTWRRALPGGGEVKLGGAASGSGGER